MNFSNFIGFIIGIVAIIFLGTFYFMTSIGSSINYIGYASNMKTNIKVDSMSLYIIKQQTQIDDLKVKNLQILNDLKHSKTEIKELKTLWLKR